MWRNKYGEGLEWGTHLHLLKHADVSRTALGCVASNSTHHLPVMWQKTEAANSEAYRNILSAQIIDRPVFQSTDGQKS